MTAESQGIPPWVDFVLTQVREQFEGVNRRLDSLVTRDAFVQEQNRVNEKFEGHGRELGELKTALAAEAQARVTAEQALAKERSAEHKQREREEGNRRWTLFLAIAGPIISGVVAWVIAGGLALGGG